MPVDYELDQNLKALAPVLDEHADWYARLMKKILYPETTESAQAPGISNGFGEWCAKAKGQSFIDEATLRDLLRVYDEMHKLAQALVSKTFTSENKKPPYDDFEQFNSLYEGFIQRLRRLEQDCALADSGMDIETGLRSAKSMERDVRRELERRERRGNPFTLALAKIDNFNQIKDNLSEDQMKAMYEVVGRLIRKCIRSFDDGYRSDTNEFVMCLKHSVASGGTAAVNRLSSYLEDENFLFELDVDGEKKRYTLTMSYCVAEPVPGDTLDELLANMRSDLERWKEEEGGAALEYVEISPLQRYITDND